MLDRYEVFLADTVVGKSIHFRLRYQIYCLREGFEDPDRFPDMLERDDYDERSIHFITRDTRTNEWLGAMRLVLGSPKMLPVARLYDGHKLLSIRNLGASTLAEASRLCVLPLQPAVAGAACTSSPRIGHVSWAALALIRAGRAYCMEHRIRYGFFLIKDSLARVLRTAGLEFEPAGPPCNHRGWRRPYFHDVEKGYGSMALKAPELYDTFCREIAYRSFSELDPPSNEVRIAANA